MLCVHEIGTETRKYFLKNICKICESFMYGKLRNIATVCREFLHPWKSLRHKITIAELKIWAVTEAFYCGETDGSREVFRTRSLCETLQMYYLMHNILLHSSLRDHFTFLFTRLVIRRVMVVELEDRLAVNLHIKSDNLFLPVNVIRFA